MEELIGFNPVNITKKPQQRLVLVAVAMGLAVIGTCYMQLRAEPDLTGQIWLGGLFFLGSASVFAFALKPCKWVLYALSGALTAVAFAARTLAIIGLLGLDNDSIVLYLVGELTIQIFFFVLFWRFWQTEVKAWYYYNSRKCELGNRC